MRVEIDGDWNSVGEKLNAVEKQFLCILQN